jgi:signal transduction histidine kinase
MAPVTLTSEHVQGDPAAARPPVFARTHSRQRASLRRVPQVARWEVIALAVGLAGALVALVVTLKADFLAYPGWLAVQKVDVILGPIGVGVYWLRQRPQSRFGAMLIALGLLHIPYIAQSSSNSALFTFGVHWEGVIYLATLAIILAFPSGRLGLTEYSIIAVAGIAVVLPSSLMWLFSPHVSAVGSISACKAACPGNALHFSPDASAVHWLLEVDRWAIIAVALGTGALLLWRMIVGTPPQRRALAIGTPLALVFLLTQSGYQLILALGGSGLEINTYVRWLFVIARSALWYGFLAALVAAQLFAARVLREIVGASLRRPTLGELQALLRKPLGDPGLELAFWEGEHRVWTGSDGKALESPPPHSRRTLSEIDREGRPAAAIVHDAQLSDDPELIQAAGTAALLMLENAELQASWDAALQEIQRSRARLAAASARERHRLEQDLHDGAQEALVALRIKLALATEETAADEALRQGLSELANELDDAISELRDIAHGIYPSLLAEFGLVHALESVARRAAWDIEVLAENVGRYTTEIESGIYYCCREALQNALRHAGERPAVSVALRATRQELSFEVRDDGAGFDVAAHQMGMGLRNMQDRVEALGGSVSFISTPGSGTVVTGAVPVIAEAA